MGIYLPNIEMPPKGQMLVIFPDGTIYVCFNGMRERLMQTTAVSVPPHGRLIDADAVTDAAMENILMWEEAGCDRDDYRAFLANYIEDAPTIIPAEESET